MRSTVLPASCPSPCGTSLGEPTLADAVLDRLFEAPSGSNWRATPCARPAQGGPAPRRPGSPSSVLPRTLDRPEGGELRGLDRPTSRPLRAAPYRVYGNSGLGVRIRRNRQRHSRATDMVRQGVPIEVVARLLTHRSSTTTSQTYVHLEAADIKNALLRAGFWQQVEAER